MDKKLQFMLPAPPQCTEHDGPYRTPPGAGTEAPSYQF
jgi:hypothetical protein